MDDQSVIAVTPDFDAASVWNGENARDVVRQCLEAARRKHNDRRAVRSRLLAPRTVATIQRSAARPAVTPMPVDATPMPVDASAWAHMEDLARRFAAAGFKLDPRIKNMEQLGEIHLVCERTKKECIIRPGHDTPAEFAVTELDLQIGRRIPVQFDLL